MNYDNLHQSLLETIAEWLDSESVILTLTLNDLRDPEPREQSELHIRMAAAAIEEMKKTLIQIKF